MDHRPYIEGRIELFLATVIFGGCVCAKCVNHDVSIIVPVIGFLAPIWFCMGWRMLFLQYSLREAAEECKWYIFGTLAFVFYVGLIALVGWIMSLNGE